MADWQPFDTAPKLPRTDNKGPLILVSVESGRTICCWQYDDAAEVAGRWVDLRNYPAAPEKPTHWMPLPEDPENENWG